MKDRVEELEETVRQLRETLAPSGSFPMEWRLTPKESRLLAALTRSGEITIEGACIALGEGGGKIEPETVRVHVARARRKLDRQMIHVFAKHGVGYYLDEVSLGFARGAFRRGARVET